MKKQSNNRWVSPTKDNKWKSQGENAERATKIFDRKKDAEAHSRQILKNSPQGGELISQNKDGKIGSKDTINRPDSNPPKDTEN